MLVVLILVVEVLILQAYVNVNRTTTIFGRVTFLTGNLVNVQREALLLNVKIEELPTTHDLHGTQVRRDLRLIDQALARAKADPSHTSLTAEAERMRPAIRRITVRVKELYDAKEQGFFGAFSGTLDARTSSERLLVGLSGLVLVVGLALALSLRQRLRKDFARAYATLTAEVEERKAAERPCGPARSGSARWSRTPPTSSASSTPTAGSATTASRSGGCSATTRPSWSTATRSAWSTPRPGGSATATALGCTARRWPPTCSRTPTSAAWC